MAVKIRGTQILDGTITASAFISNLGLDTNQLADGAEFLKRDGTVVLTGNLNMGSKKAVNLADPTSAQDAATKSYVDAQINPVSSGVFKKDGSIVATGSFNMGGNKVTGLAEPTVGSDAATKNYVDLAIQGLTPKDSARVATTANITLSGTQTIDGVALAAGDRVLVKAQTTASANGIYVVAAGAWVRSDDANTGPELKGAFTFVQEGTTQADTGWVVSTDGAITLNTTPINFVQFSSAGQITVGNGLSKVGNIISVITPASSGILVNGAGVQVALDSTTLTKTATGLKLSDVGAGKLLVGNASGIPTAVSLTGDVTIDASGVTTVANIVRANKMVMGEVPAGTINGSNAVFTLSALPSAGTESVYYNGTRLVRGAGEDYTISGSSITMISYIPLVGDKVLVDYIKA